MYPILFQKIIPQIGFGWAIRVLAFVMLGTLVLPLCIMKLPTGIRRPPRTFDKTVTKDYPFQIFAFSSFFGFLGLYIPFFYIQLYSINKGITNNVLVYLLPITNAGSFFGRIVRVLDPGERHLLTGHRFQVISQTK